MTVTFWLWGTPSRCGEQSTLEEPKSLILQRDNLLLNNFLKKSRNAPTGQHTPAVLPGWLPGGSSGTEEPTIWWEKKNLKKLQKKKRCSPYGFTVCFPRILASFPRFSFQIEFKKLDGKELLHDWKFLSHKKSSARGWRTPLGTSQTSFAHSQLYCYKCNHRDAYTSTVHWMYNVELTFQERKFLLNMSIVLFYRCLLTSKNTKTEEENLVLISLNLCLGRRPSTVPKIPSRPLGTWAVPVS